VSAPTNLAKFKKQQRQRRAHGNTLCKRGFHKWVFAGDKQFDVKQGKLISIEQCERCQRRRTHVS
jgi:hypothetical protein